jgi:hypothetical protein
MELVEGDGGVRRVFADALDEGGAHVDADLGDRRRVTAMCGEIRGGLGNSDRPISGKSA